MENFIENIGESITNHHKYCLMEIVYFSCLIIHFCLSHMLYISDNSLVKGANENQRSNYRCYTCILYCNESWDCRQDGGALRLYKDSLGIVNPKDAIEKCEYVDINPDNGKLLIFDSRLIHSVQKVTSSHKERIAFTLWTLRPEDNGCVGEIYDTGEELQYTN